MKNFVVLNKSRKVLEVASNHSNLTRKNDSEILIVETELMPWIGDTLSEDGTIIPSSEPDSERGKASSEKIRKEKIDQDHSKALDKIANAAGLSKDEKDALKEKERANVKKII